MKRKPTSTQGKPVLGEGAFQQLLAAVYVLQEQHDRLLEKEPKADCAALSDGAIAESVGPIQQVVPLTPERVAVPVLPLEPVIPAAQADVEPLASCAHHLGQSFLTDVWNRNFGLSVLAEVSQ